MEEIPSKLQWRIYYSDGSTYDNLDGEPQNAPYFGVLIILCRHPRNGWRMVFNGDHYIWQYEDAEHPEIGTWQHADIYGKIQYDAKPGWRKSLAGELISDEKWAEFYQKIKAEKTGFTQLEAKPSNFKQ